LTQVNRAARAGRTMAVMNDRQERLRAPDPGAAAKALLARGWSVIPIERLGKRPVVPWQIYQSRLPSAAEVEAWFGAKRQLNVGVVTGAVSNLVVLDVDSRHGGDESLTWLEVEHGPLPRTVEAKSGGGGRHLYFAHPGGSVPSRAALAPGIDVRADGGCIVAPPSLHAGGGRYEWVRGRSPDEAPPAPLPQWLLELARPPGARAGRPPEQWRSLLAEGVAQGRRNSTLASLAGHLLGRGVDPKVAQELLLAWNRVRCRPPLPDEEAARVVESITRLMQRKSGGRPPGGPG
jgi:hypothetical protein